MRDRTHEIIPSSFPHGHERRETFEDVNLVNSEREVHDETRRDDSGGRADERDCSSIAILPGCLSMSFSINRLTKCTIDYQLGFISPKNVSNLRTRMTKYLFPS